MKKIIINSVLVSLLANSAGCSTIVGSATTYSKFADDKDLAKSYMNTAQKRSSLMNRVSGIYVDTTPIKVSDQKSQLLETFPDTVVFSSKALMSIREIADRVTKLTGIPVSYNDIAGQQTMQSAVSRPPQTVMDSAEAAASLGLDQLPVLPGMGSEDVYNNSNPGSIGFPSDIAMIDARFKGQLTDFLDHVAGRTGLFWKFDSEEKRIVFFRYETKSFALHILPGTITANAELENTATSSSSEINARSKSESGQAVTLRSDTRPWEESRKVIEKMLSRNGRLEGNEALGSLVVTDTPVVLAEIGRYVDQINKIMSRQVAFDISIYDIEIEDDNKLGIDWNFVWNEAGKFAVGYSAVSVAASAVESGANFVANWNNPAQGSEAFIRALETQGRLSLKTHQQTMTLNNTPIPVKVAEETTYLASATSGTTNTASIGTLTTQLLPGKVVSGLTMTLLPRVFDANQLMLQMSMDITDLRSIDTITSGDSSIQAPKLGTKSFIQRVAIKNNETLILSGFDQDRHKVQNDRSLDIPGGLARNERHVITVVMITPRITEGVSM